ncbi:hypothetical protein Atep_02810 [Allochromatium tepidum]|uniref:Uncharacterized protein n=2 Tax=Allochromatium tepidum TaxID=553982 RepID=A0ABN6G906_9GAMM|nr:hypothetical protein Atep_02810 [Allochromatium tepidum]
MMRDYKFKRTEWTPRRKRRFGLGMFLRILALLAVAGAGYAIFDHFANRPSQANQGTHLPSHIIPLQLPPQPN